MGVMRKLLFILLLFVASCASTTQTETHLRAQVQWLQSGQANGYYQFEVIQSKDISEPVIEIDTKGFQPIEQEIYHVLLEPVKDKHYRLVGFYAP